MGIRASKFLQVSFVFSVLPRRRAGVALYTRLMTQPLVKDELRRLVESLPEDATWDDVRYAMYIREQVELGRKSAREEPLLTTEEVFAKYRLEPLS